MAKLEQPAMFAAGRRRKGRLELAADKAIAAGRRDGIIGDTHAGLCTLIRVTAQDIDRRVDDDERPSIAYVVRALHDLYVTAGLVPGKAAADDGDGVSGELADVLRIGAAARGHPDAAGR